MKNSKSTFVYLGYVVINTVVERRSNSMEEKNRYKGVKKVSEDDLAHVVGGLDISYVKNFVKNKILDKYQKLSNDIGKVKKFFTEKSKDSDI